ncbi:MAG TPA: hypothetical protein VFH03_19405 [Actinoplanes sp.]|nr:hypothetical protein [Actinoplanes sp.]
MAMTGAKPVPERVASSRARRGRPALLAAAVAVLAAGVAAVSLLGPLVLGVMRYRTSATTVNQLLGGDAAGLFVVAPLGLLAALLAFRGHAAGSLLASGVGVFALYTYAQVIVGQEYLRLPPAAATT